MPDAQWLDLKRHPSTRADAVHAIAVLVRRSAADLHLTFRLDGDIRRLVIAAPTAPRIDAHLWQHTCFEAFIAIEGQPAYHEFNFAPSGEWAVYAKSAYRSGNLLADESMRPNIFVRSTDARLELDTLVRLDTLSAIHPSASLCVGLAAVIESGDGLSYWALHHARGKPDFHDDAGFVLRLQPGPD